MINLEVPGARREEFVRDGHWRAAMIDSYVGDCARQKPDAVAIVDGANRLTYRQLDAAADSVAAGLAALDVAHGSVVSWQLPNWFEAIVLHHAILRLGAISNPIIPIYRQREVGYILAQARSTVLVIPENFRGFDYASMIAELRPALPELTHLIQVRPQQPVGLSFDALLKTDASELTPRQRSADDPVLLMFTSGTTALPKGVLHTHNTLDYENRSIIDVYGLSPADVIFMPSPLTHITGLLYGMQLPAMLGTKVVLQDVWEPGAALRLLESERCSFTLAATPFLHGLINHPDLPMLDVSSMRVFACGGADVPPALIREAAHALGCAATRVYGSTEFPTLSTSAPDAPLEVRSETDGRPIAAAEFRIVDDADRDVARGDVGELLVRGPELFPTYLDPGDNDGAFTEDGWFRTGDRATADEANYLCIRGRSKDIVVRGGENISVIEVEELLYEHPSVREVAIVAMPDPVLVERACAFVVPQPGTTPSLPELMRFLETKNLAKQKLPERLELVEELPKTSSGKVQKFLLRQKIRQQLGLAELRQ